MLSSRLRLGLPSDLFPSGFPTKTLYALLSHACYIAWPSYGRMLCFETIHNAEEIKSNRRSLLLFRETWCRSCSQRDVCCQGWRESKRSILWFSPVFIILENCSMCAGMLRNGNVSNKFWIAILFHLLRNFKLEIRTIRFEREFFWFWKLLRSVQIPLYAALTKGI
jgi:hypothetical protein